MYLDRAGSFTRAGRSPFADVSDAVTGEGSSAYEKLVEGVLDGSTHRFASATNVSAENKRNVRAKQPVITPKHEARLL